MGAAALRIDRQNETSVDTREALDVWGLLVWAYRDQKAGRLGLGRGLPSKLRWMNYLASLDGDGHPDIHPDAGAVHRVVVGLLPDDVARMVIEFAERDEQPEPCFAMPMPIPVRDLEHGGRPLVKGQWEEVPPLRLTAAEREKLEASDGHGEIERPIDRAKTMWTRYRIDLRKRRHCFRARMTFNTDGTPRARDVGFTAGDDAWVPWCPVEYSPSPEFVAAANAIRRAFTDALETLERALAEIPFRAHKLRLSCEPDFSGAREINVLTGESERWY